MEYVREKRKSLSEPVFGAKNSILEDIVREEKAYKEFYGNVLLNKNSSFN